MSKHLDEDISQLEIDWRVEEFEKWIKEDPELPNDIDKMLLLRYLKTHRFDLNKAQALLKFSFSLRCTNQNIFIGRDFLSSEVQQVLSCCYSEFIPLLKTTPQNYKCCIMRLSHSNANAFCMNDVIKTFFMVQDVRLVSADPNPNRLADGEVPIFDMTGYTIWHLLKTNLSTLRLYFKYVQEAHPVRVQQIHVYNCTPLINRIMSLIKPFLRPEVAERFQFHAPGSDTLLNFFPREMLPNEYGGSAGPINDVKEFWLKTFIEQREYIKKDSNWIVNTKEDVNNNKDIC